MRNLNALGLALLAAFAMSTTLVSTASAQGKLTSDGPVTLTGTLLGELGSGRNATTGFGRREECPNATYTGHKVNVTPHAFIPSGSTEITITPHYGLCSITTPLGAFPTTVDMNGCDYVFDIGGTVSAGTYAVSLTIVCPAGKLIQTTVFKNLTHSIANRFCTVTYTHNVTSYTGLHATNEASGDIRISGTVKGIKADQTTGDGGESNMLLCPTQTSETLELHLDLTVKGNNEVGGATSISISD